MPVRINATRDFYYSLKREIDELYWSVAIRNFGGGLVSIFIPIYVYLYTKSVPAVFLFYLVQFAGHALLVPLTARLLPHWGVKKMMAAANPFLAIYLVLIALADTYGIAALVWAVVAKIIYLALYLPAEDIDFSRFAQEGHRGRQIGNINIIASIANTIAPMAGGFAIAAFGFLPAFTASGILMALSSVPLFFSREVYETYTVGWRQSFTRLFAKRNRRDMMVFFLKGVEETAGIAFWPLFVFVIIGEFKTIGLVTSASLLAVLFFTYFIGRMSDHEGERKIIGLASFIHGAAWIVSTFITTPLEYLIGSSFLGLAGTANRLPFMALIFKKARERGDGIDEYLAGYEIAVELGLVTTLAISILLWQMGVTSWLVYFGMAAAAALGFRLIREK